MELAGPTFRPTSYLDENNQQRRCFDMDRDGFTLLAMWFTGNRAELSLAESAKYTSQRKALVEAEYPEMRHGAIGRGRARDPDSGSLSFVFSCVTG
jgi:Phage regulatory protein Rha (Phage_pRha)